MHDKKVVHVDLGELDRQHANDPARQGTAEAHAPAKSGNGEAEPRSEPRPLIETPPMARRGE